MYVLLLHDAFKIVAVADALALWSGSALELGGEGEGKGNVMLYR
jgi:hypothetical protein